jgi:hypothetical protein
MGTIADFQQIEEDVPHKLLKINKNNRIVISEKKTGSEIRKKNY